MRIAQVSPLIESVPPSGYGGIERIVSYLTEGLVNKGHEVTLFATGDSETNATLEAIYPRALRLDKNVLDHQVDQLHWQMFERVIALSEQFDIIHFHTGISHFPICRRLASHRYLTTHHGRLDSPTLLPLFFDFNELLFISISNSQRRPIPWANWFSTVYNGIPNDLFTFYPERGKYLAFLGRISPEKRVDRAIAIAKQTGMHIKIAAKIDKMNVEYFNNEIRPLFNDPQVEYVGEINDHEKNDFLGNAYALLFPIDWPEPFGLVMIEAMACGTPVVAYRMGAVPEIMRSGTTGYIVDNLEGAVNAIKQMETFDRKLCRSEFEKRFTARHMVENYLEVYNRIFNPQLHISNTVTEEAVVKSV